MDKAKGRAKEAAGALKGDANLKRKGQNEQAAGSVKKGVDKAGDKIKDAVDKS